MKGVVAGCLIVVGSLLQNGKLLLHILIQWQNDGNGWHEHIAHKRLDQVGEGSRKTVSFMLVTRTK
jgi:hypothetical protein